MINRIIGLIFILSLFSSLSSSAVFTVTPFKDTDTLLNANASLLTVYDGTSRATYLGYNFTILPNDQILVNSTWTASYNVNLGSGVHIVALNWLYNNTWDEGFDPNTFAFGLIQQLATQVFTTPVNNNQNRTYTALDELNFVANFYDRNLLAVINNHISGAGATAISLFSNETNRSAFFTIVTTTDTSRIIAENSSLTPDIYYDIESENFSTVYTDYIDFYYSGTNNTIQPNVPMAFITSESNDTETLRNIDCKSAGGLYQNTSHVSAINVPVTSRNIFCFNLTGQHENTQGWFGAIKVLIANSTNFTFFSALYAPAFNVTVAATPTPTPTPAPSGADANIISVSVSDSNPTRSQEVIITTRIENTGSTSTLILGQSIGNVSGSFIFCDIECYIDGFGDFREFNVSSGGTIDVTRTYIINPTFFTIGDVLEIVTTVRDTNLILVDKNISFNAITIVSLAEKLDAFALSAVGRPARLLKNDIVSIRTFIFNNGTFTHNFTIGMSIGLWNVGLNESGVPRNVTAENLIPPCNTGCFEDQFNDFVFQFIPANFSDPTTRRFRVPDYFLDENGFDVAIAIYSANPIIAGGELITVTYFKNVSFVEEDVEPIDLPNVQQGSTEFLSDILGIDEAFALNVFAILISVIVGGLISVKSDSTVGIIVMVMFVGIFSLIGWLPIFILIIFALIAAAVIGTGLSNKFSGGQ